MRRELTIFKKYFLSENSLEIFVITKNLFIFLRVVTRYFLGKKCAPKVI